MAGLHDNGVGGNKGRRVGAVRPALLIAVDEVLLTLGLFAREGAEQDPRSQPIVPQSRWLYARLRHRRAPPIP